MEKIPMNIALHKNELFQATEKLQRNLFSDEIRSTRIMSNPVGTIELDSYLEQCKALNSHLIPEEQIAVILICKKLVYEEGKGFVSIFYEKRVYDHTNSMVRTAEYRLALLKEEFVVIAEYSIEK